MPVSPNADPILRRPRGLAAIASILLHVLPAAAEPPPMPVARPIVIAHRGASGYLPEHSLPAKALAHAQGADALEQDVVMSRDGVPIVLHDTSLDATTDVAARFTGRARADGKHHCTDFTLAELRTLSLSERIDPATGRQVFPDRFPHGHSRFAIVTLEEELAFVAGLNRSTGRTVAVYPEVKAPAWHRGEGHDVSKAVVDILWRHGYATKGDPCFIQCFDPEEVIRIRRELGWQGRLVQLIGGSDQDALVTPEGLARIATVADGIGPSLDRILDASGDPTDLVARAHAAGLVVHPYTLRRDRLPPWAASFDDHQGALFAAGVDGAFSDFPDLTAEWLRGRTVSPAE
jgi:glycerophosphoryl diester phosphodiesterase